MWALPSVCCASRDADMRVQLQQAQGNGCFTQFVFTEVSRHDNIISSITASFPSFTSRNLFILRSLFILNTTHVAQIFSKLSVLGIPVFWGPIPMLPGGGLNDDSMDQMALNTACFVQFLFYKVYTILRQHGKKGLGWGIPGASQGPQL
jgi:hypothetical protein